VRTPKQIAPELPPASFLLNVFGSTMVSLIGGNPVKRSTALSFWEPDLWFGVCMSGSP